MIVADTGAVLALIDAGESHHRVLRAVYEERPDAWVLPWAVLPEIDYLLGAHVGRKAQQAFLADVADGIFAVEWGREADLDAAARLDAKYAALALGLVDAVVMATAERLKAEAIATLDVRHFGAVAIKGHPRLLPRDLGRQS
jgi:predicted nucleic acid-binding protein